jgi:hypothetical protein
MAGLVPAVHVLLAESRAKKGVDARDKRGHDGVGKHVTRPTRGFPQALGEKDRFWTASKAVRTAQCASAWCRTARTHK